MIGGCGGGCPSNQSLVQQSSMAADLNQVNYVMEGGKDDNNEEDDKNDFLLILMLMLER